MPLLKELADPVRLRVSELAGALGLPMPQLSNHLRRLREAGLVQVERSGRHAATRWPTRGCRRCCRCSTA